MERANGLDTDLAEEIVLKEPSGAAIKRAIKELDFSKMLIWDSLDCLDQFYALIEKPPIHSVVVHVDPVMARAILDLTNTRNRPIGQGSVELIMEAHREGYFERTGDTIKFSQSGTLIDGQYRLTAGMKANKGFETHMVFGLPDAIFDILDRQRTRTASDILAIEGVKSATIVAGAVRWVRMFEDRRRGIAGPRGMSPRRVRELATGPLKGLSRFTQAAEQIRGAYKIPPTMTTALLFLIHKGAPHLVDSFVQDWLSGNRNYARNRSFDTLVQHIQLVRGRNNGHLNRTVLAAALVHLFNHWHANVAATTRQLSWNKEWAFPKLAFDKQAFLHEKTRKAAIDTSLPAMQDRMLLAIDKMKDKDFNMEQPVQQIARTAKMDNRHVTYVLNTLADKGLLHLSRKASTGKVNQSAIWHLKDAGRKRIAELHAESAAV